jgi:zinc protease
MKKLLVILSSLLAQLLVTSQVFAVDIQEVKSPSGIKAYLVENYNTPLITLSFSFAGGATQDPTGKEGVTRLLSTMLDEGSGDINGSDFQALTEKLGVEIGFRAERDYFTGRLQTLSKNSAKAFDLLRLALNEPRFDVQPLERMRQAILVGLKRAKTNPSSIASRTMREALFNSHPYSRSRSGGVETVSLLTRDDLIDIHHRLLVKKGLVIGVVGAISEVELAPILDYVFSKLPDNSQLASIPEAKLEFGKKIERQMDITQSIVSLALPGLKRQNPDFFAAFLANHILGGGTFSSRLYDEVREKRGLAYSVFSQLATFSHAAYTMVGLSTSSSKVDETVNVIRDQLKEMAKNGPTAEELAAAKKYVIGSYAIRNLDTSVKVASVLVAIQQINLGIDYIDRREALINSVTLQEVKRAASKLLNHEPTLVIVGPTGKS